MNRWSEMNLTYEILYFIIIISVIGMSVESSKSESSAEYLQKVMIELQKLNAISTPGTPVQIHTTSIGYKTTDHDIKNSNYPFHYSHSRKSGGKSENGILQNSKVSPVEKTDLRHSASEVIPQYYQVPTTAITDTSKTREPEILGFTRAELAAMYNDALKKGSAISLSSLVNTISPSEKPQIIGTHLELSTQQPLYNYYFFPLKSFESELKKDYEHNKLMDIPVSENIAMSSQKQIANPLFVAISTFISMALLFMMGILFLPKLHQFNIFSQREIQDDVLYVTNVVMKAIDKFTDQNTYFKRITGKINEKKRKKRKSIAVTNSKTRKIGKQ